MRGRCTIFLLVLQLLALHLCLIDADSGEKCTELKAAEATWEKFKNCGQAIEIEDENYVVKATEAEHATTLNEKQWGNSILVQNTAITKIKLNLIYNKNQKEKSVEIIGNDLLTNLAFETTYDAANIRIHISGNRRLKQNDLQNLHKSMEALTAKSPQSHLQDFGECLPTTSFANLSECVYVLGDLILNSNTKTNEDFPKTLTEIRGCLKITGTGFTKIDFAQKLSTKNCKGDNEIKDNKELCIHPEMTEILNARFPKIIMKNNKICPNECTSEYAISRTNVSCKILTTDLVIRDQNASITLNHLKSVQEVRGSVVIVGNKLEKIDFLEGLETVDSSKSTYTASIQVKINKDLKEFSLPAIKNITHNKNQKAIYLEENANYTMPDDQKKGLIEKFGREDVIISDYQKPVEEPEWEYETEVKENKTTTVQPEEESNVIYIAIIVPLCIFVAAAIVISVIVWYIIRHRRKKAPAYLVIVPKLAPRDIPNIIKYIRKLPWMVFADKIMAENVKRIEEEKNKRLKKIADGAATLKLIREHTREQEARLKKEGDVMLDKLNNPEQNGNQGEEKREKAGKEDVERESAGKDGDGEKYLEEIDANGEPYAEQDKKKSKKDSKKEKKSQQKPVAKENVKKEEDKKDSKANKADNKQKETKENLEPRKGNSKTESVVKTVEVKEKMLSEFEKTKKENMELRPYIERGKVKAPLVNLPDNMPEAVLYFDNSQAFGVFYTRFDDIRKNPIPSEIASDVFEKDKHNTLECECKDPHIAAEGLETSHWQPAGSSAPSSKVYGIRWQNAFCKAQEATKQDKKKNEGFDLDRLHVSQFNATQVVYEMPFSFTAKEMVEGPLMFIKDELDYQEENRKRLSFGISSSGIGKDARPGTKKNDWTASKKTLQAQVQKERNESLGDYAEEGSAPQGSDTTSKQDQSDGNVAENSGGKPADEANVELPDADKTQTVDEKTVEEKGDDRMKAGQTSGKESSVSIKNKASVKEQEKVSTNARITACAYVHTVLVYNFKDSSNEFGDVKKILKNALFGANDSQFVYNMITALMSCSMNRWLNFVEEDIDKLCDLAIQELSKNSTGKTTAMATARLDVRIVGEIRGRFDDLRKALSLPKNEGTAKNSKNEISSNNHIFLGNYVGGYNTNLETVCLLFCMKVLYKDNCCLLRGALEWSEMNEQCGFLHEMIARFGEKAGRKLWKKINEVFSWLPLACVAGETILCVNSGIVPDIVDLDEVLLPITKLVPDTLPFNLMFGNPNYTVRRLFDDTDSRAGYYFGDRLITSLALDYLFSAIFTSKVLSTGYGSFGAVTKLHTLCSSRCYNDDGATPTNQIYAAVADYEKNGELTFRVYWQSEEDVIEYDALKSVKIDPKIKSQMSIVHPQDSGGTSGASNNSVQQSSNNNSTVKSVVGGTTKSSIK